MNTSHFFKSMNTKLGIFAVIFLFGFAACEQASDKEEETQSTTLEDKVVNTSNETAQPTENTTDANAPALANTTEVTEVAVDPATAPVLTFEQSEFNFGQANEGDLVKHVFTFTNTGKSPLIIANATASCGCTVPDWPKEPIAPGQKSQINVEFNTKGKPGIQNKTVTITANTVPAITTLKISGTVKGASTNTTNMMGPVRQ